MGGQDAHPTKKFTLCGTGGQDAHPTRKFTLCGTGILPVLNRISGAPPLRKFPLCGTGILPVLNNNSSRTAANSSNYSRTNQMSQTQSFRNFTSVCQKIEHPRYYFWLRS